MASLEWHDIDRPVVLAHRHDLLTMIINVVHCVAIRMPNELIQFSKVVDCTRKTGKADANVSTPTLS